MRIHFVGIGGVSMVQLAEIARACGHTVTGSDLSLEGHNAAFVEGADLVVYTVAVSPDNCEVAYAREHGIPLLTRAQFLKQVCSDYQNVIAICGSHGKTTATAMAAEVFLSKRPSLHIGGSYAVTEQPQKQPQEKEFFITEACEYRRSFLSLTPDLAIVLNTELDHTDCYRDEAEYRAAFYQFCAQSQAAAVFGDDPQWFALAQKNGYVTFGFAPQNDYTAQRIVLQPNGCYAFDLCEQGAVLGRVSLAVAGEHNVLNALAAAAAGRIYGLSAGEIVSGLEAFGGVSRRFEFLGTVRGAGVYSDYAHHPSELRAMVKTAKESGTTHVTVVFEPHTYSRTQSLQREFAQSLLGADSVYLMPIYAAREQPIDGVGVELIADELKKMGKRAVCPKTTTALYKMLFRRSKSGGLIVFAGAGTIDDFAREFVRQFES